MQLINSPKDKQLADNKVIRSYQDRQCRSLPSLPTRFLHALHPQAPQVQPELCALSTISPCHLSLLESDRSQSPFYLAAVHTTRSRTHSNGASCISLGRSIRRRTRFTYLDPSAQVGSLPTFAYLIRLERQMHGDATHE